MTPKKKGRFVTSSCVRSRSISGLEESSLALVVQFPGRQDGGMTTWPGLKLGVLTVLSRIIELVTSSVLLFSTISTTTELLSTMSGVDTRSQSFVKLEYLLSLSIMVCFYL